MKKLFLTTTALTAFVASPADAAPVGAAVAWLGGVLAGGGLGAAILKTAIGIGMSMLAQAFMPQPEAAEVSVKFDIEIGDDTPLNFTVGEYATAGKRKYAGSWGKDNRYVTQVIELSCLPQDGIDGMWLNDEPGEILWNVTEDDGTGYNLGHPLTNFADEDQAGKHFNWVRIYDGTQTAADPMLVSVFGNDPEYPWTAAMVGTGKTYAIVTWRYNRDTTTSPPQYLFQPKPLSLYDWRKDSTNGGSGSHRWGNRSTYEPTRNPAVIAYNIARGIYYGSEWVFGGKNLSAWQLPVAEWTAAANECDAPVTLSGGGTEPQYRAGMEISADMEPAGVLEELGRASNLKFPEVGGVLKAVSGLPGSAVFSITDGDIIITEGQSFKPFFPISDTYNALSATYPEPAEKWTTKDAPQYIDAEATADDNGRYLPTSMAYPAVPFKWQVQRLMRSQMRDYRRFRMHQFHLPPDAYGLEPGDVLSWSSNRNGYNNKLFVIESVAKTPGMNVLVSLREVDPGDYDWSSDFERPVTITVPANPKPFIQTVDGFNVQPAIIRDLSGEGRYPAILAQCNGDAVGVNRIQIQARVAGRPEIVIDTIREFSAPHAWYLQNVLAMETYEVRARLLSTRTPKSQWSSWLMVTTPDVRLGSKDVRYHEIIEEVREDFADYNAWADGTGAYLRELQDEIEAIRDSLLEIDFGTFTAREVQKTELRAEIGETRANLTQQIAVAASATDAVAQLVTELEVSLGTKASSSALNALTVRVTETEDGIVSVAQDVTQLTATVGGKASATALNALSVRVSDTEDGLTSMASDITSLKSDIAGKANATAVNALTTRVSDVEGEVTAQSESIISVQAQTDRGTASGLLRIEATSNPSGAQSRIGIRTEASANDASHSAALYLEAKSDGTNQIIMAADRVAIATGITSGAAKFVPFVVDGGVVYMDTAFIRNGEITNAKIGNFIQSNDFVTGPNGSGWRINKAGVAEFNNVIIRRQIEVASGSLNVGNFTPQSLSASGVNVNAQILTYPSGDDVDLSNGPGATREVLATPVAISEWQGAKKTYIATAGMSGSVSSNNTSNCYWGWSVDVLPLTKWSGNQSLRLKLDFWSKSVTKVQNCVVDWKIYEVS